MPAPRPSRTHLAALVVFSCGAFASRAVAAPPATTPVASQATPKSAVPTLEIDVTKISAEHIRAMAVLYRVAVLDEAKLFDAVDAVAARARKGAVVIGSEAARKKLATWERDAATRISKADRRQLARRAVDALQLDFEPAASDPSEQMKAYGDLVVAVAASANAFKDSNVSGNTERDSLASRTQKAAADLARTMSLRGYGAAYGAASRLADHVRDALAILEDPSVADAYGARGMHDLIGKMTGGTEGDVARAARLADAGARMLEALADSAALVASANKTELARRLAASAAAQAEVWLAEKRAHPKATASQGKVPALCFDGAGRLVPCRVQRQ